MININDTKGIGDAASSIIKTQSEFQTKLFVAGFKIILVGTAATLVYFGFKNWNVTRVQKKVLTDPDAKIAFDIFNAIPTGLKKGTGSLFNPFGFISDVGNSITTIWQSTDTDRILNVIRNVKNPKKVVSYFEIMYGEPLIPLLAKVLSASQLDVFVRSTGTYSLSNTSGKFLVCNQTTGVKVRKEPKTSGYFGNLFEYGTANYGKLIGQSTGREVIATEDDISTVFSEIKLFNRKTGKFDTLAYTWKGGYDFLTATEVQNRFGINNSTKNTQFFLD